MSRSPWLAYGWMLCKRPGPPPISTSGLGIDCVCSCSRVPLPPQRMTTGDPSMRGRSLVAQYLPGRESGPLPPAQETRHVAGDRACELARRELQRADPDLAARGVVAPLRGGERRKALQREVQDQAADPDADDLHGDRRVSQAGDP